MPILSTTPQVGVREELADYLAVVDAKSTPFMSMAPKGKDIGNMTFSWQVDDYASPSLSRIGDGDDITVANAGNASANRKRMSNYANVFRRDHRTGFIAETQKVAGVSSETARGVAKRLVEIKRDMEATFLASGHVPTGANGTVATNATTMSAPVQAAGGSAGGNQGASLGYTLNNGGSDVGQYPSGYQPTYESTATTALTESNFQNMLTGIYGKTGTVRDYDLICGTTFRRAVTGLTEAKSSGATNVYSQTRTFNQELSETTLKSSIDVFEGDFGRLIVSPDVFIGGWQTPLTLPSTYGTQTTTFLALPHRAYVIPMDMVEVRYAKLPEVKDLPDAGGGPAKLIQAIAGLVVKNPSGFGFFNNVVAATV